MFEGSFGGEGSFGRRKEGRKEGRKYIKYILMRSIASTSSLVSNTAGNHSWT